MTATPPVQRLEHWTLVSTDVERTKRFYTEILGAELPERAAGPPSVNLAGTVIDFFPASDTAKPQPGGGLQHHAYIIRLEDYDPWVQHFERHNVPYHRTTHGMGRMSIYVDDPDGYHIEFTVLFEDDETGKREIEKRGLMSETRQPRPF